MDKECIEMFRKAGEIQRLWKPSLGDYVSYQESCVGIIIKLHDPCPDITVLSLTRKNQDITGRWNVDWLPRLDQLCKIFKIDFEILHRNDGKIEFWVEAKGRRIVESVEQGLLEAGMYLKWGKVWDSEKGQWQAA